MLVINCDINCKCEFERGEDWQLSQMDGLMEVKESISVGHREITNLISREITRFLIEFEDEFQ